MLKVSRMLVEVDPENPLDTQPRQIARLLKASEIDPETPYLVIDTQTKQVVGKFKYKDRNRARAFANKKDQEYGAVRYICKLG